MKARIIILPLVLVALFFIVNAGAQQQTPMPPHPPHPGMPPNAPHPPNPDPLAHLMFPPDLIMGHARQLGLTDEQKTFMRGEIQKTTVSFHELQWKLQDQMELLHEAMKSSSVNEQQALAQLDASQVNAVDPSFLRQLFLRPFFFGSQGANPPCEGLRRWRRRRGAVRHAVMVRGRAKPLNKL